MQKEQLIQEDKKEADKIPVVEKTKNKFWFMLRIYLVEFFDSMKNKVLKKINAIDSRIGYPFNNNPKSFDDLTPSIIENEETYTGSIFWALKNKNIKNIAH